MDVAAHVGLGVVLDGLASRLKFGMGGTTTDGVEDGALSVYGDSPESLAVCSVASPDEPAPAPEAPDCWGVSGTGMSRAVGVSSSAGGAADDGPSGEPM